MPESIHYEPLGSDDRVFMFTWVDAWGSSSTMPVHAEAYEEALDLVRHDRAVYLRVVEV